MKLTAILLLVGSMAVSAHGRAQERVTLNLKGVSLKTVLDKIQEQTGYSYAFSGKEVQVDRKLNVDVRNVTVEQALDQCLKDLPVTYEVTGRMIKIVSRPFVTVPDVSPDLGPGPYSLIIYVVGEDGNRLAGATVKIAALKVEGVTDETGALEIKNVAAGSYKMEVSFVGYQKAEGQVSVKDLHQAATVGLKRATARLDEVQIIAYGQTTERLSTGDITTVGSKDIENQPISNPVLALEGRVPGLFVTEKSGVPGSSINVLIRGQNSMSNGNDPFYVVDGVPYSAELLPNQGSSIWGIGSPLNYINPSDVESISVLKDADATAIYGSRAANGAILITTKRGKPGKSKVDVNASSGIGKAPMHVKFLNNGRYLSMRREAFANDGVTPNQYSAPDLYVWDTTQYTNWEKSLLCGTAHYTDASASLSGGNENTSFLFGTDYRREGTVFPFSGADQKGSVHFNITNTSDNRKFKATLTGSYQADYSNLPSVDLTSQVYYLPPDAPKAFNPDGSINWANGTWPYTNPYAFTKMTYQVHTYNLISNATLRYALAKGLELKSNFGYTNMQVNEVSIAPIAAQNPAYHPTGTAGFTNNSIRSWIIEPQASYAFWTLGGRVDLLAGSSFQENTSNGMIQNATGYTSDALLENIQAAPVLKVASNTQAVYKYNALFARVSYNVGDKYLLNASWRRDGSSRFGPDKQFHNFAAVGAGWVFSKESFVAKGLPWLSFGKLRGSYGTTGNDQIGDYRFYNLFTTSAYPYQGTVPLTPSGLYNPDLAWEQTRKAEGGISLGFLKDRILAGANYYQNHTNNQLLTYNLPAITGFTSISANLPATVENYGWEFTLNTINIKSKNVTWSSSLNVTMPRNKLVSFPGLQQSSYKNQYIIGKPITIRQLYRYMGVNDTTGTYQFATAKGNITSSPSPLTDRLVDADFSPRMYGGLENNLVFHGFELDIFFQFTKQKGTNFMFGAPAQPGGFGGTQIPAVLNSWQGSSSKAPIQQFSQSYGSSKYPAFLKAQQSDFAVMDASYIRLRNLVLSYRLPSGVVNKMKMENLRIYIQGQNLWTITKYNGWDPVENFGGSALPPLRMISVGLEATL